MTETYSIAARIHSSQFRILLPVLTIFTVDSSYKYSRMFGQRHKEKRKKNKYMDTDKKRGNFESMNRLHARVC